MIPSLVAVDLGGSSEFPHAEDDRVVEHSPGVEIFQEGGHRRVELAAEFPGPVEVVLVGIPVGEGDLHEPDTRPDEAARHEAGLSEGGVPVCFPQPVLLPGNIERLQVGGADHFQGPVVCFLLGLHHFVPVFSFERLVLCTQERLPLLQPLQGDSFWQDDVFQRLFGLLDDQRGIFMGEEPGARIVASAKGDTAGKPAGADAQFLRHQAPHVGVVNGFVFSPPGMEKVAGGVMVGIV